MTTGMTTDRILDHCRTEWMFQDLPERDLDDMIAELRDHLDDTARAGKIPETVVGEDITAFATAWAAARRAPARGGLPRRLAGHTYAGAAALLAGGHLVGWTTLTEVVPASVVAVALFAAVMTFTPYWRALFHWPLWRWIALCTGFSGMLLGLFLVGGRPVLLHVPLWATGLLLLPGALSTVASLARRR
ncbi:hypothetical protein [Streptomyces hesseae]|uniref:DUF1707 domain-containing protein n=1 Tax=Streptomyces hesseae TaxID=3075519 RepID=A0ABU2SGK8_9ACTN|nr:hypothetical protein [Streptomyces sp. DSM 40473]MDT0448116.1 hypothetical protein [Streptomyces sp. DSM 40473]